MSSKVNNKIHKGIKFANQNRNVILGQFQYLGRWVNKDQFRAYVYNSKGDQKLANSYNEFQEDIASGLWFASKPEGLSEVPVSKERKQKYGIIRTES